MFVTIVPLLFLFLLAGLAWRQLAQSDEYRRLEEHQSLRRILQPGPRGDIFDRHGNLLVGNDSRFSAVLYLGDLRGEFNREFWQNVNIWRQGQDDDSRIDYQDIVWQSRTAVLQRYLDKVNDLLGEERQFSIADIRRTFDPRSMLPFPLKRDLTLEEYAILTEGLPPDSPVQIHSETTRFYPYDNAAAHTLGYVVSTHEVPEAGVPGEELTTISFRGKMGRSGIENAFDSHLQGESGGQVWKVNHAGYQYALLEAKKPQPGQNLITSLDISMQLAAEKALGDRTGAAVAIEIATGEVLVMASKPDYNLNDLVPFISNQTYADINERGAWLNRATQGLYPPGSTFKLVTALAALRSGAITPETELFCSGSHVVGNRAFPCWNRSGHGSLNLAGSLENSCNVYYYKCGIDCGVNAIAAEARLFGLDQPTGIDIPFESQRMIIPDPQWKRSRDLGGWVGGDTANMSIGQGYLIVTPLQMACFTASLAAGRTLTTPTFLHEPEANAARIAAEHQPIGIDIGDYQAIIEGMKQASLTGTARRVKIDGLPIGSKTGTAQVRRADGTITLAWYVGFAPIDDPQIAVAVLVEGLDPRDGFAGGLTAAPIARAMFKAWLED